MSRLPDLSLLAGETVPLSFDTGDDTDTGTATITVKSSADSPTVVISKSAAIAGGVADLTIDAEDTEIADGNYVYQITAVYGDGVVEKYPDQSGCTDEECEFPAFKVCEALDLGVS